MLKSSTRILITVTELSEILSLSPSTIWRMDSKGELPEPLRLNRTVRWRADEIQLWIDAGCPSRSIFEKSYRNKER